MKPDNTIESKNVGANGNTHTAGYTGILDEGISEDITSEVDEADLIGEITISVSLPEISGPANQVELRYSHESFDIRGSVLCIVEDDEGNNYSPVEFDEVSTLNFTSESVRLKFWVQDGFGEVTFEDYGAYFN